MSKSKSKSKSKSSSSAPAAPVPKSKFPDGTNWITPYFRAITNSTSIDGHQNRHVAIPSSLVQALGSVVGSRDKTIAKMRGELDEIHQANRNGSSFRGLQRNGSNGWAVLVAKENSGNKGRQYIGTYLDETLAATKWDQGMLRLNGLSMVWKLNNPTEENTLKMIKELQRQSIGQPLTWCGKSFENTYTCTKYFGVFRPIPGKKSSDSSKAEAQARQRAIDAGLISEDDWVPGMPAPFVAIARCGGKTSVMGRFVTIEEAAAAYDEVASITGLPTNDIPYDQVRLAREKVQANATAVFANEVRFRGMKTARRSRKKEEEGPTDGEGNKIPIAKVPREELRALKADRKKMEKFQRQVAKLTARLQKSKDKEQERKDKKKAKQQQATAAKAKKATGKRKRTAGKSGANKKGKSSKSKSGLHAV